MNDQDLTVVTGAIKVRDSYTCLLTDRPCGLVPVKLRRMLIIPPIVWIGWRAELTLPLSKQPTLAYWQYLRLLRPFIVFFVLVYGTLGLAALIGTSPGSPLARLVSGIGVSAAIMLWFILGYLLQKFEFVRLLRYNNARRTVTVRFSSAELAQRALDVLVQPEEKDMR